LKYFLPLYLFAYLCAAFFWRSFKVWKETGVNPVVFNSPDNAHDFIGQMFKLLFALIFVSVFIHSFLPNAYSYLGPILWLQHPWLRWTGTGLLILSLLWTVVAQAQMGESWRIGIDHEHQTALVRTGVFGFSRNPIFLGMTITLVGLSFVIPNTLTALTLLMGVVLIQIQVRLEEEFLAKIHGKEYCQYRRQVRRWL
jgi:protein-S-isoprenylcysteine O-methyltransferase Ste14